MSCEKIKNHVKNVCLKGEYGDSGHITKFVSHSVEWVFAEDSEHTIEDENYIHKLFEELSILTNIHFVQKYSIKNVENPYILIYIGNQQTFDEKYLSESIGNINVSGYANWNARNHKIYKSNVFVSSELQGIKRRDVLREEITQALGNTGDTEYNNTIFYQYKYKDNDYFDKYFDLDKKVLIFLYNQDTLPGQTMDDIDNMDCKSIEAMSRGERVEKKDIQLSIVLCIILIICFLVFTN